MKLTFSSLMFAVWGWLLLGLTSALAVEKSVQFQGQVQPGKWTASRLRNLNGGAMLQISFSTTDDVEVVLLSSTDYRSYAQTTRAPDPLFQSFVTKELYFSILAPRTDDYYLIVNNSKGKTACTFTVRATVSLTFTPPTPESSPPSPSPPTSNAAEQINTAFARLTASLKTAFQFDELTIQLVRCPKPNAYSTGRAVYLCVEYVRELLKKVEDPTMRKDILLFVLMHEISHVFFTQWKYPFNGNEEVVDEFTTVLLLMFDQRRAAEHQAQFFAALPPEPEMRQKLEHDDRHPLSVQRARNLQRWLTDPDLLSKWQPFLVPHMQTPFLQKLQTLHPPWLATELVTRELATRLASSPPS